MNEITPMPTYARGGLSRRADHPIDSLFLDRWSPRAMSGAPLAPETLASLFEAARWAPSSSNQQPWRILYAHRDGLHWRRFFELLGEGNRIWAHNAGALLVFLSRITTEDGKPIRTHSYDTGAAWMSLALQGARMGLVVHGMAGFDYEAARRVLDVPEDHAVEAMAAVGHPGDPAVLNENHRAREKPSDRRPIDQTVREGGFGS